MEIAASAGNLPGWQPDPIALPGPCRLRLPELSRAQSGHVHQPILNRVGVCVKLHDSHYQSYDEGNDHHHQQANLRERRVDRSHNHVLDVHEDE